jgi:prevent-host-death family protein
VTIVPTQAVRSKSSSVGVSVAHAKAHLSELLTGVEKRRHPITILRRGRPVAQIVPVQTETPTLYGSMRGTVVELGDIVGPTGEDWGFGDK